MCVQQGVLPFSGPSRLGFLGMGAAPSASCHFFARKQGAVALLGIAFVQCAVQAIVAFFVFWRFLHIHFFRIAVVLQGYGIRVRVLNHISGSCCRRFGRRCGFRGSRHSLCGCTHGDTSSGDLQHKNTAR